MTYQCSECRKPIGRMADMNNKPILFKCPYSGRVASAVEKSSWGK